MKPDEMLNGGNPPPADPATGDSKAGEASYRLTVPARCRQMGVAGDPGDPLFQSVCAWAMERNLNQDDMDALTGLYFDKLIRDAEDDEALDREDRRRLVDRFAGPAMQGRDDDEAIAVAARNLRPVYGWIKDLLAPEIAQDQGLGEAVEDMFRSPDALAVLTALRRAMAEQTPPRHAVTAPAPRPKSREEIMYGATTPAVGINHKTRKAPEY